LFLLLLTINYTFGREKKKKEEEEKKKEKAFGIYDEHYVCHFKLYHAQTVSAVLENNPHWHKTNSNCMLT
jgi:hypothetical protein